MSFYQPLQIVQKKSMKIINEIGSAFHYYCYGIWNMIVGQTENIPINFVPNIPLLRITHGWSEILRSCLRTATFENLYKWEMYSNSTELFHIINSSWQPLYTRLNNLYKKMYQDFPLKTSIFL